MTDLLVYGSYGYTGRLIADVAVDRGLEPTLAGRNGEEVREQAEALDCPHSVFSLDDPAAVESALADVDAVLHCAGPFLETYEPLVDACIETGTDYLDITGEIDVFEAIAAEDEAASAADVTLLPGVGFDVVPTDCLAAHLADRLPDASHLSLGFQALGSASPGTAKTAIAYLDDGGLVRRDGQIERIAPGSLTRRIDFGRGETTAAAIPWGDVSTAYHTTGVPNVEVYMALPKPAIWTMRTGTLFGPLLGSGPVQSLLTSLVEATVDGPDERERERGRSYVWGEVRTDEGDRAVSRLETLETYALTARTAVEIASRVLDGEAPAGYQTPAGAFGPDLILDVGDTTREDVV